MTRDYIVQIDNKVNRQIRDLRGEVKSDVKNNEDILNRINALQDEFNSILDELEKKI